MKNQSQNTGLCNRRTLLENAGVCLYLFTTQTLFSARLLHAAAAVGAPMRFPIARPARARMFFGGNSVDSTHIIHILSRWRNSCSIFHMHILPNKIAKRRAFGGCSRFAVNTHNNNMRAAVALARLAHSAHLQPAHRRYYIVNITIKTSPRNRRHIVITSSHPHRRAEDAIVTGREYARLADTSIHFRRRRCRSWRGRHSAKARYLWTTTTATSGGIVFHVCLDGFRFWCSLSLSLSFTLSFTPSQSLYVLVFSLEGAFQRCLS